MAYMNISNIYMNKPTNKCEFTIPIVHYMFLQKYKHLIKKKKLP